MHLFASIYLLNHFGLPLLDLYETCQIIPVYTHNSIEKVQLPDMGSYRCAVLSESHQTFSEEGSIQLEGEFIFSFLTIATTLSAAD